MAGSDSSVSVDLAQLVEENRLLRENLDLRERLAAAGPIAAAPIFLASAATQAPARTVRAVREVVDKYWRDAGHRMKDAGTDKNRIRYIKRELGDLTTEEMRIGKIDGKDGYYETRFSQVSKRTKRVPTVATVNREVALLKKILNWAVAEEYITRHRLKKWKPREESNIKRAKLLDPELARMREFIPRTPAGTVLYALILVLVDSGMRLREGFNLRWRQFEHDTGRCTLLRHQVKGGKNARSPRLSRRALEAVLALPRYGEFVFANPDSGEQFDERYLYRIYREAIERAKIPENPKDIITFHSLRHTFVYRARREWDMKDRVIMEIVGHTTIKALERYGKPDDDEVEAALNTRDKKMAEAADAAAGERKAAQRAPSRDDDDRAAG